jgi:hypothetical protein
MHNTPYHTERGLGGMEILCTKESGQRECQHDDEPYCKLSHEQPNVFSFDLLHTTAKIGIIF